MLGCRIKRDFALLLADNDARPEEERLPRSFFDIDPEMKSIIEQESQDAEKAVRDEMRWESEKQRIAIQKIKGELQASCHSPTQANWEALCPDVA
jgi:hypothetical protein